jgi:CDP-diacylglycerol pyrophosphatase
MKRFACIVYIALSGLLIFNSCIREDISGNTPEDNFEALWKIIDEQYCFLDYKSMDSIGMKCTNGMPVVSRRI